MDSFVITPPICKFDGPSSSTRYFHTNQLKIAKKQFSLTLSSRTENDEDRDFSHVTPSTTIAPSNKKLTTSTSLAILVQCATMMIAQNALAYDTTSYDFEVGTSHNFFSLIDPRYLVAGGGCAALSHGIATPLDVIKTKMQANRKKFKSGFLNAAISIVQTNDGGIGVLLSGLVPTLLGYGVEGAVKFGMYESFKPVFVEILNAQDKTIPYLAASVGAGAAASLLLVPMERKRIEAVTTSNSSSNHGDEDDGPALSGAGGMGAIMIDTKQGMTSLFYGYNTMLLKQVPYTMTKQVSFDLFATNLFAWATTYNTLVVSLPTEQVKFCITTTSAFLASILACLSSQPGDVLLTKLYQQQQERHTVTPNSSTTTTMTKTTAKCASCNSMWKEVYREEGLGGLFLTGLSARLAHVGTIVTMQLLVYDYLKQLLGLPATVSDC